MSDLFPTVRKYVTVLYGRTSKDDPRTVTIDIQRTMLRDWAARDPLVDHVAAEFWDEGISGKIPLSERPAGRQLVELVAAGRIHSVAVAYSDRFGRTLLDGVLAAKELEDRGVKLVAVNDGWDARRDDSPLYFQLRMAFAEEEHRRIVKRMADGKARAMDDDNAPPGGPLVFGYRMDQHGQFTPDPPEAALVMRLFEMALLGFSQPEMLDLAKSTGLPAGRKFQRRAAGSEALVVSSHRDARWHLTKIAKILTNRTYLGERRWGRRVFPCVPLVDPETYEKVQALLASRKGTRAVYRGDYTNGLVSGLFRCGLCGGKFYRRPTTTHRKNGQVDRYLMYACHNSHHHGCKAKLVRVDQLDEALWAVAQEYLSDPEALVRRVVAAHETMGRQVEDLDAEHARLDAELRSIDREVAEVWEQQRLNNWPMAWVATPINGLNARREAVAAAQGELKKQRAAVCLSQDDASLITQRLAHVRAQISGPLVNPEVQAQVLRFLVAGGVIETVGEGRKKSAILRLQLRWGELVTSEGLGGASREVPKECSYGSERGACLELTVPLDRARPSSRE